MRWPGYISHHDTHFGEVLDEVRLDRPFAPKIEEVFTRIDEKNAALLPARESDDPEVRASVRGERPTGPSTKQRVKATIRTVPADAVRDHLVSFNAASLYHLVAFRGLRRQQAEKLAWGSSWKETGRIFTQEDGSELTPDWVSEHFWRLVFAAGLPPIRIHDLRHGAATLSLAAGTDMKYVSAMLRHSSIGITSDIYTAVLPDVARAAAEAAVRLVPRKITMKEGSETGGPPSVPQAPLPPPAEAG